VNEDLTNLLKAAHEESKTIIVEAELPFGM